MEVGPSHYHYHHQQPNRLKQYKPTFEHSEESNVKNQNVEQLWQLLCLPQKMKPRCSSFDDRDAALEEFFSDHLDAEPVEGTEGHVAPQGALETPKQGSRAFVLQDILHRDFPRKRHNDMTTS